MAFLPRPLLAVALKDSLDPSMLLVNFKPTVGLRPPRGDPQLEVFAVSSRTISEPEREGLAVTTIVQRMERALLTSVLQSQICM